MTKSQNLRLVYSSVYWLSIVLSIQKKGAQHLTTKSNVAPPVITLAQSSPTWSFSLSTLNCVHSTGATFIQAQHLTLVKCCASTLALGATSIHLEFFTATGGHCIGARFDQLTSSGVWMHLGATFIYIYICIYICILKWRHFLKTWGVSFIFIKRIRPGRTR